jgi:hypothetical protein
MPGLCPGISSLPFSPTLPHSHHPFDQDPKNKHNRFRECFIRLQVSIEMIRPSLPEQEANHIINAGYKFAKKRFSREFKIYVRFIQ